MEIEIEMTVCYQTGWHRQPIDVLGQYRGLPCGVDQAAMRRLESAAPGEVIEFKRAITHTMGERAGRVSVMSPLRVRKIG